MSAARVSCTANLSCAVCTKCGECGMARSHRCSPLRPLRAVLVRLALGLGSGLGPGLGGWGLGPGGWAAASRAWGMVKSVGLTSSCGAKSGSKDRGSCIGCEQASGSRRLPSLVAVPHRYNSRQKRKRRRSLFSFLEFRRARILAPCLLLFWGLGPLWTRPPFWHSSALIKAVLIYSTGG